MVAGCFCGSKFHEQEAVLEKGWPGWIVLGEESFSAVVKLLEMTIVGRQVLRKLERQLLGVSHLILMNATAQSPRFIDGPCAGASKMVKNEKKCEVGIMRNIYISLRSRIRCAKTA